MLEKYHSILTAPDWQPDSVPPPAFVAGWLLHTDSLTQKLQQICPALTVEITQQGWQNAFAKNSPNQTACWLREVVLKCTDTPWIFAQTVLPQRTIEQVAQAVPTLGDQPIGLWLFPQNPARQSLEWRQDPATGLYARRSTLLLNGYPLEIRELFLADFPF